MFPVNSPPVPYSVPVSVAPVASNVPSFLTENNPPALISSLSGSPLPIMVISLAVTSPVCVTVNLEDSFAPVTLLPAQNAYGPDADKPV